MQLTFYNDIKELSIIDGINPIKYLEYKVIEHQDFLKYIAISGKDYSKYRYKMCTMINWMNTLVLLMLMKSVKFQL